MSGEDEEGILFPPGSRVAQAGRWEWAESSEAHSCIGRGLVKSSDAK